VPLASKLSVALHMGQTRGPAFLLFKWVANLAYLSLSSTISPFVKCLGGILTDLSLLMNRVEESITIELRQGWRESPAGNIWRGEAPTGLRTTDPNILAFNRC